MDGCLPASGVCLFVRVFRLHISFFGALFDVFDLPFSAHFTWIDHIAIRLR
jgi:hypothetical protein